MCSNADPCVLQLVSFLLLQQGQAQSSAALCLILSPLERDFHLGWFSSCHRWQLPILPQVRNVQFPWGCSCSACSLAGSLQQRTTHWLCAQPRPCSTAEMSLLSLFSQQVPDHSSSNSESFFTPLLPPPKQEKVTLGCGSGTFVFQPCSALVLLSLCLLNVLIGTVMEMNLTLSHERRLA